jgi:hypothetical protein
MLCGFFLFKRTFNPKLETLNLFGGSLSVGLSPTFSTPCGFILAFFSHSKTFGLSSKIEFHSMHSFCTLSNAINCIDTNFKILGSM